MKKKISFLLFIIVHCTFMIEYCEAQWVQMTYGWGFYQTVYSLAVSGNYPEDSGQVIFAGTHNGIYLSENNGESWSHTSLNNEFVYSIVVNEYYPDVSGQVIFAGKHSYPNPSGIWLSTNNGQNWSQTALNNKSIRTLAINGNNIFAGTIHHSSSSGGIYLSTNNGQNWSLSGFNGITINTIAISGNNPEDSGQVVFAGTPNTGVWLSTNNGQNWIQTTLNDKTVYSLGIDGNNIFAGTYSYGIYLTTNNGQNWTRTAFHYTSVYSLIIDGNNIFAGSYGIYLSTNNGANWIEKNQGFNTIPYIHSLLIANDYIFVGTSDQSVWRRSLAEITGIKNISTEIPSAFSLGQNYPNPFNSMTNVKFKMLNAGEVKIVVYDVAGKEVARLVDEELEAGVYEVRFDAGDLPSGIYFYRMEAGSFSETRKLILLK